MFGKLHSAETKARLSGENNPMYRQGDLHPMYGKSPSAETRALISEAQGTAIFVFSSDDTLVNSFSSNCYISNWDYFLIVLILQFKVCEK
jgi:hypothetical protein